MKRPSEPAATTEPRSAAASELARGRPDLSRSFRLHRPRGPFCGRGYCHQCLVATGQGSALACETTGPIRAKRTDPLRLIGKRAEGMYPWFYETRFGRPRWLRQRYLRALRRLSSAPTLPLEPCDLSPGAVERLATEVLVVGAGASGIRAARDLSARGHDVLVLEQGPAVGDPTIGSLDAGALDIRTSTICIGLYGEEGIAAAVGPEGPIEIVYQRLVVATGAYDAWLLFEGNDLPGIIGLRGFERFGRQGAFVRSRIGVFAAPQEAARALAFATAAGIELAWMAGPAHLPPADLPSYATTRIVRAHGRRRLSSLELEGIGRLPCDVLILGFTQPTYELQAHAGVQLSVRGVPPRIVIAGSVEDVEVVGEAASSPPDVPEPAVKHPNAFVCLCEDVRLRDVVAAVGEGFEGTELVKRRTGASTGACQGRLCIASLASILVDLGMPEELPTSRPPIVSVPLVSLAADA